jgi:hypothetical protein
LGCLASERERLWLQPDNLETRQTTALTYLKETCPSANVVDEATLSTGKYLLGNSARTYHVYVACA